jgi:Ankyrin repeat
VLPLSSQISFRPSTMNVSGRIHSNVFGSNANHVQKYNSSIAIARHDEFRSLYRRQPSLVLSLKFLSNLSPNRMVKSMSKRRLPLRKTQASFLKLVDGKKFDEIITILRDDQYDFKKWLPKNSDISRGQSALHLVLQSRPPVEIVELLMMRMKQVNKGSCPELGQDELGMTPLHVAVARECDASIIERLLCGNNTNNCLQNSAAVMDRHKRYPLHYICSNQCRVQSKNLHTSNECTNSVHIIKMLVKAFPAAVHSTDKFGWSPFKMAEKLCADESVLRLFELNGSTSNHTADETNTECESEAEKFPVNEICFQIESGQNDDDLSSVGWNISKRFEYVRSQNTKTKSDVNDVLHMSFPEIDCKVPVVQSNQKNMQKYRFL